MDGSTLASPSAEIAAAPRKVRPFSPWLDAWRRFRRHRLAFASAIILVMMILAIAFGPFVWRGAVNDIDFSAPLEPPPWAPPLGADELGQELLSRLLYWGRLFFPACPLA